MPIPPLVLPVLALLAGCSRPEPPAPSSTDDTASTDTGSTDADSTDTDTGATDTGATDTDCAPQTWHADADGDGYGDAVATTDACDAPAGYVADATDCDDANPAVNPAAAEVCDGVDDDCDGATDEDAADAGTWHPDADGDGYGDSGTATTACDAPAAWIADGTDCDDGDATVNPTGRDRCGVDGDCDGARAPELAVPADYATITAAITAAADGDRICVSAGDYPEGVDYGGKDLVIEGAGSDVTRIELGGDRVTMTAGELVGFTVSGGTAATGTALQCSSAIGPIQLEDLVFADNTCGATGSCRGMVYLDACDAALTDVTFRDNQIGSVVVGGAIYATTSDVTMDGVRFEDNDVSATGLYGGLVGLYSGTATLEDVSFSGNTVAFSGDSEGVLLLAYHETVDASSLEFSDNTVTSTGTDTEQWYGALLCAIYDTFDIEGASVTGNVIEGSDSGTEVSGLMAFGGDPSVIDGLSFAGNTLSGSEVLGGLLYTDTPEALSHVEARGNVVTAASSVVGGVAYAYSLGPGRFASYTNVIAAGNTVSAGSIVRGGLLCAEARGEDALALAFADLTGNEVSAPEVEGGLLYAWSTTAAGSAGVDVAMVDASDNTVVGTVSGSVYGQSLSEAAASWSYSNAYGNTGTAFDGFADPTGSDGNVAVDPAYSDATSRDPADWDLTLQPSSPLRDAGDPAFTDPDGSTADVGAFGGPNGSWP